MGRFRARGSAGIAAVALLGAGRTRGFLAAREELVRELRERGFPVETGR